MVCASSPVCVCVCLVLECLWKNDGVTRDQLTVLSKLIGDAESTHEHGHIDSDMADKKVMAHERDEEHAPPAVRKSHHAHQRVRPVTLEGVIVHHDSS